jgi:hypothetical protein
MDRDDRIAKLEGRRLKAAVTGPRIRKDGGDSGVSVSRAARISYGIYLFLILAMIVPAVVYDCC